jgi:hypothetical protein
MHMKTHKKHLKKHLKITRKKCKEKSISAVSLKNEEEICSEEKCEKIKKLRGQKKYYFVFQFS